MKVYKSHYLKTSLLKAHEGARAIHPAWDGHVVHQIYPSKPVCFPEMSRETSTEFENEHVHGCDVFSYHKKSKQGHASSQIL